MRILAITYAFSPISAPATFRLLKWFTYMRECGHHVSVICVDPDSAIVPVDRALEQLVPEGLDVHRAPSPEERWPYRLLRLARPWLLPVFEPYKREWYKAAVSALRKVPLPSYDVVFTCSQPAICHVIGLWLRKERQLPWIAYFSDPWSDNPYQAASSRRWRRYNAAFERKVIHSADRIVFSSEETRRMVMKKYSQGLERKSQTLDHCFVPQWFDLVKTVDSRPRSKIEVVLTGTFYGPRSPIPVLEMILEHSERGAIQERLRLNFYGKMSLADARNPVWDESHGLAVAHGPVDYLDSLSRIRAADCLLLIDAASDAEGTSVFFPSKLAEYIGSGRPILGVTPRQGTTARILRDIGCKAIDSKDKQSLMTALQRMADGHLPTAPDLRHAARFHYQLVGRKLVEFLNPAYLTDE